jgi:hypothetical protein
MCQACEEMDLYEAYMQQVEESRRMAQPWMCEVTLFPTDDAAPVAATPAAAEPKSRFVCDGPE